jgi:hypothetical protein
MMVFILRNFRTTIPRHNGCDSYLLRGKKAEATA